MKIPKPKYKIESRIYVFTKNGMQVDTIRSIEIRIQKGGSSVYYQLESSFDYYCENQIYSELKSAKNKLVEISNQLPLLLN